MDAARRAGEVCPARAEPYDWRAHARFCGVTGSCRSAAAVELLSAANIWTGTPPRRKLRFSIAAAEGAPILGVLHRQVAEDLTSGHDGISAWATSGISLNG